MQKFQGKKIYSKHINQDYANALSRKFANNKSCVFYTNIKKKDKRHIKIFFEGIVDSDSDVPCS